MRGSLRDSSSGLAERSVGAPGHGYPGRLLPYAAPAGLQTNMQRYGLTAGWYVRDAVATGFSERAALDYYARKNRRAFPDRVPFLLYTPESAATNPLPMLVFLPGRGEVGTDLNRQFRQRGLIEKITSKAFQERHPCHLLIPSPPEAFTTLMDGLPHRPSLAQNLMNDAILTVARGLRQPSVDLNRLYITGLSYGGNGAYALGLKFPGRYAAVVPVAAGAMEGDELNPVKPGNWWHFCNEGDYRRRGVEIQRLETFQSRVKALGGDFRIGTFPGDGHDAWSRTWREEAVWEWMFSKTADGRPVADTDGAKVSRSVGLVSAASKPACTASVRGRGHDAGPERGADGLMTTAYVSERGLKAGEYWQAEFSNPVAGRFCLTLGNLDGSRAPTKARVNVSDDGESWITVHSLSKGRDFEVFMLKRPVRYVRILSTAPTNAPETLIVRELVLEEK